MFSLVCVVLMFAFIFKTYLVQGKSMNPTLVEGNRLFVICAFYKPSVGDIVVMDESQHIGDSIVKRIIAIEGQTVNIDKQTGEITVDGIVFDKPIKGSEANLIHGSSWEYPITVPEGHIFVMGDNRANSLDSRYDVVGFIDTREVIGKALFIISPIKEFRRVR